MHASCGREGSAVCDDARWSRKRSRTTTMQCNQLQCLHRALQELPREHGTHPWKVSSAQAVNLFRFCRGRPQSAHLIDSSQERSDCPQKKKKKKKKKKKWVDCEFGWRCWGALQLNPSVTPTCRGCREECPQQCKFTFIKASLVPTAPLDENEARVNANAHKNL